MTKTQFLDRLRKALHGLSEKDILGSLDYYAEMIDDRVESGMDEEAAVAALGVPEEIARAIILDLPLSKIIKSKCKKKTVWRAWEIVLLILGSPLWIPLIATAAAVLLTVYAVLWVVVACLWSVDLALGALSVGCIVAGIVSAAGGAVPTAILYLGVSLVSAGLAVASFLGCLRMTVVFAKLTVKLGRWVKSLFVRKDNQKEDKT